MFRKCTLFAIFLQAKLLFGVTAEWQGTTNVWTLNTNWNPQMVPQMVGDIANLTNPTPTNTTITLMNSPITLTQLNLDLGTGYIIQPGGGNGNFTFSGGNPSLNVTTANGNGMHTLQVDVHIGSAFTIEQDSSLPLSITGRLIGGSNLIKSGTGTLTLSADSSIAPNQYTGQITIDVGTISIANDNNLGIATTTLVITNGILSYSMGSTNSRPFSLTGTAGINVTGANLVVLNGNITGAGSLTKGDTGNLQLGSTSNTYQGGTTISGGSLTITDNSNLGTSTSALNIGSANLVILATNLTIPRPGNIFGNAVMISGGANTFSGDLSGTGNLTVQGGGTFTFVGANSYTGGTFVDAGTHLSGTTNGLQGNITLNTATSQVTFSQNFDGAYSGALMGPVGSSLTKVGSGAVTFTGTSPFSGTTNITQGTLIVNGSLASSPTTVQPGGALGGSGTVGPVMSMGLIDPGSGTTAATLTINGMLTMSGPSARTNINIAPLASDRISVLGLAMLTGPLQIDPVPGFYGFNASYTVLTSAGLGGSTFSSVTSTVPSFVPTLSYTLNDVLLSVVITEPFAVFPFSNANTAAVGNNIDAIYAAGQLSPDLRNVFDSFIGQSFDTINDALDQMHPAPYSAFTEMQAEVNGQLISLFHRLPYLPCSCNNPNRLWIEGFANSLTMKRHGLEIGFQANSGGIAFGYDGQVNESLVLGIGGAWTNNHLDWHDHRGHGDMNALYGGIYFDSQVGSFYFGGTFLAGMDFYDTSRHIKFLTTDRRAVAHFEALDMMGQIATAYLFGSPQAFFYPYANIDYLSLYTHKFSENGAGGLDLDVFGRTDGTLRTEMGLGLQVQDRNAAETACISPVVSIGWVNMCPIARPKLESTFTGTTIPFKVIGWDESWNLLNVNFGLSIAYRCYSLMLDYNVEFSPDSSTLLFNQHGNLRLDWKW